MRRVQQITCSLVFLFLFCAVPALGQFGRVNRETIFALTTNNRILTFNSLTPGTITSSIAITGLMTGESVVGIDFRPANRQLYGVSSMNRILIIDTTTGAVTPVGMTSFMLSGTEIGIDFNPAPDRIRLVSNMGQDLRLNPADGTLSGTDGVLAYATGDPNNGRMPNVVASAYTNNFAGISATSTTLYNVDSNLDILVTQGSVNSTPTSPNTGQLFTVGALGVNVTDVAGLDISDVSGTAFAVFTLMGETTPKFYTINLATGAATLVGNIGGMDQVRDITIGIKGEILIGVTTNNTIVVFNSTAPGTILRSIPITGLSSGETLTGVDFRPATGQLFAIGSSNQIYTISPITGVATRIGTANFMLTGTEFGVDFNPAPDRIRLVSNMGQNLRLNPNDGTLAGTDTKLDFATGDANVGKTPNMVASAYSNNVAGTSATGTTLYNIDSTLDILVTQGSVNSTPTSPNTGQLFTVGALGVNVTDVVAFDISDVSGVAYAAFTLSGETNSRLFRINLATGAATQVGAIGAMGQLRSLAVVLRTEQVLGLTTDGRLVVFNPRFPSAIIRNTAITGLQMAETLVGIDFRPATGLLFGLGSTGRVYLINPVSGMAQQVGSAPINPALAGMEFGFDFNPQPDRIRVVSNSAQDLRLNPNNGAVAGVDGTLAFAMGDPNAGAGPNAVASAYTNSFAGTPLTTLYNIDSRLDILVTQGSLNSAPVSPNTGMLFTVGRLGVDTTDVVGFDISESTNIAYAALQLSGETSSRFYTVNLSTGAVTQVGTMPIGGMAPLLLRDIAVVNNVALSLVAFGPATPVIAGNNINYTITLTNANISADLANVVLSTSVPANTTFQSIMAPVGFNCTTPAVGATGQISCTGATLNAGSMVNFLLAVRATGTTNGDTVTLMANVKSDTPDPTGVRFDVPTSTVATVVNLPGPMVVASGIKVSNKKITVTGTGFMGTTITVDGVAFAQAAKLNSTGKLIQKGKLANGMKINQAIPKGKAVMFVFRNSNGGVTTVPFTR
ncbi:MAG: DUF4394 domain-containing protein [Acidobacteriota bacterium]